MPGNHRSQHLAVVVVSAAPGLDLTAGPLLFASATARWPSTAMTNRMWRAPFRS
jgi:hypothetical protein